MKNKFTFMSYSEDILDYESLIKKLEDLSFELKDTNLKNLSSFISSYILILKSTQDKMTENLFSFPETLQSIDIKLAKSFFKALHNYITYNECPFVWREYFEQCEQNTSWEFVYMSMGFNAQINYDLSFVLKETLNNASFKEDYDKMYDIVTENIKNIILRIHGDVDNSERKISTAYSMFFNVIYHRWKESAWENFINLKSGYIKQKYIEKSALDILKQIIGTSYFRQYFSKGLSKLEVFKSNNKFLS